MNKWFRDFWLLRRMNWAMVIATVALLFIGVFFVYSSCYVSEDLPVRSLYKRQITWALTGMMAYLFFAIWDYRQLGRLAWWIYGLSLMLLFLVLIVGASNDGAQRWLTVLGIRVQPAELAKLSMILAVARYLSTPRLDLQRFSTVISIGVIAAIPFFLILAQPDLGTAMIFVTTVFTLMFAGRIPMRTIVALSLVALLFVGLLLSALFLPERMGASEEAQLRFRKMTGLREYQFRRIETFLDDDADPFVTGYNKMQSMIAVGSGGPWGKGYLKGTQNILGFLPRSVAPTDFIYSVIAEEKGFFGSVVVLGLFAVILVGGMLTAAASQDPFGRLLCVGIGAMVFFHVFINIAMTVGIMPITGLPLPLLSYGGSFMLVMMSALGIVQSVCIRSRRVGAF